MSLHDSLVFFALCQLQARCQQNFVSLLLLLHPLLTLERQLLFLHQHLKAQLAALSLPKPSTSFLLAHRFQRPLCTLEFISFHL